MIRADDVPQVGRMETIQSVTALDYAVARMRGKRVFPRTRRDCLYCSVGL